MLVTDPEIVEEAYAFDNPCFKDVTTSSTSRTREGAVSLTPGDTPGKDSARWSTSWTSLGLGSTNRNDKRKTLDDSCLGVSFCRLFLLPRDTVCTGIILQIRARYRAAVFQMEVFKNDILLHSR